MSSPNARGNKPSHSPSSFLHTEYRLEKRRKELQQQKDDLIKETKAKVAAIDNVRSQLDIFLKVRNFHVRVFTHR